MIWWTKTLSASVAEGRDHHTFKVCCRPECHSEPADPEPFWSRGREPSLGPAVSHRPRQQTGNCREYYSTKKHRNGQFSLTFYFILAIQSASLAAACVTQVLVDTPCRTPDGVERMRVAPKRFRLRTDGFIHLLPRLHRLRAASSWRSYCCSVWETLLFSLYFSFARIRHSYRRRREAGPRQGLPFSGSRRLMDSSESRWGPLQSWTKSSRLSVASFIPAPSSNHVSPSSSSTNNHYCNTRTLGAATQRDPSLQRDQLLLSKHGACCC